jgi:hypothetical protein
MFFVGILDVDVSTYVICIFVIKLPSHIRDSHGARLRHFRNSGAGRNVRTHVDKWLDLSLAPCQCLLLGFDSRNRRT